MSKSSLILASASPRRRQLLQDAGIPHVVRPTSIPETQRPGEEAIEFASRLAREKAGAIPCGPSTVILGADTIVVLEGEVFGKPRDDSDARRMLEHLSGREHVVYTAICLRSETRMVEDIAATRVRFEPLSEEEIAEYVGSGEPMDKAGAYGIQGLASKFVSSIEGSYQNVVGLPVVLVYRHLKTF